MSQNSTLNLINRWNHNTKCQSENNIIMWYMTRYQGHRAKAIIVQDNWSGKKIFTCSGFTDDASSSDITVMSNYHHLGPSWHRKWYYFISNLVQNFNTWKLFEIHNIQIRINLDLCMSVLMKLFLTTHIPMSFLDRSININAPPPSPSVSL